MKKFIKILGITIISILVLLYLAFLFVLPNAIDLNKYKPDLQKLLKTYTNLVLDFDNAKVSTTPLLGAGLKADGFRIKLPDGSEVISAESFTGRISLPHLLFLTVRISTADIVNPKINIDIVDGKAFKAVQAYEEILNKKEEKIEENIQTAQKPLIDPASIKIVIPAIKISNFEAWVNDLKTTNYLKLRGDELVIGYNNGKSVSLKTNAELFVNETKNINANIDIDTFLPQHSKLDKEDDKAQRVEIPFINPVAMYMAYDLKTNVDSKIKIRQKDNRIVSNGYFNVDNFTLKLAGLQLPESKFHVTTRGTKADLDTDLFITQDEKLSILGFLNYGDKPSTDIRIKSTEIHLDNILNLMKATLDSLHIQNNMNLIKGEGFFKIDTYLKTNFKKMTSNGQIVIDNCAITAIKRNKELAKANSIISLENNVLKFIDTSLEIAETVFKIDGIIDEKSVADINIKMEKMPLAKVFTMFLPAEINNAYQVNSGNINLSADIKGELKKAIADVNFSLQNLSLLDRINKITYIDNILSAKFTSDFKTFQGKLKNSDFKLMMNGSNVTCEEFNLAIGENDIEIAPSDIVINNSTKISLSGLIKNYLKNPIFNINIDGKLITADLKKLLGKDLAIFINNKGIIPLNVNVVGDKDKQTLNATIEANKDNFITPITIKNVENKDTVIKTTIDFKGDRLKIKDTGFFVKVITKDPKAPEKTIISYNPIIDIDGTITKLNTLNPNINLIKVKLPKELDAVIYAFPQSRLKANGNMFVFGDLKAPRVRGEFDIWDMSIPELLLNMERMDSKFESKNLDINVKQLVANGSDYNGIINIDLNPSKNFVIKNINLISNLTNVDELMKVVDKAMKYMPQPSPSTVASNAKPADIPVIIKDGTIDIKHIQTGAINLYSTTGKLSMKNNIIYINNLLTSGFDGKIKGNVSANAVTMEVKANVKGDNLNVEKTLLEAAAMKDTLTGTMDFNANIGLKGATYEEQMKTLKGKVDFTMKKGSLGPFGKIENLIMAENVRESAFFQTTIGTIINSLLSFDTTKYNNLNGELTFDNGIAQINPIKTDGPIMATYIFGDFDLLKNRIDIKLRGRLGSQVSDSMGPLALLNPVNLVKATPGMGVVLGKLFFLFTQAVTEEELAQIPTLGKDMVNNHETRFQVIVRGDVAKPLTLVKSFKWLALQSDIDKARSYTNALPEKTKPAIDLSQLQPMTKEEFKTKVKEDSKEALKNSINNSMSEETKEQLKKGKEDSDKLKEALKDKEGLKQTLKDRARQRAEKARQNALNKFRDDVNSILYAEPTTDVEPVIEDTKQIPIDTVDVETTH